MKPNGVKMVPRSEGALIGVWGCLSRRPSDAGGQSLMLKVRLEEERALHRVSNMDPVSAKYRLTEALPPHIQASR